ncbi:MAG: hypothetical protein ATN35_09345 [Epulopiscium sp. Nele67-Bin004]|nr:MAG: hypothetical protein ATN35_09345 [Epulopiscium sp. Nele67-Bin004]
MKPFKTHEDQLAILEERGLKIINKHKAILILSRENYYNIVNGYKNLYLQRTPSGEIQSPERYKPDSTFEELYLLFQFDRDLRNCLLKYLLIFETSVKAKLAYRFSEQFKGMHDYLIFSNYTTDTKKSKSVLGVISSLINTQKNKSELPAISHYLNEYGGIPLWVLVKYLTFGNINFIYSVCIESIRNKIAQDFSIEFQHSYNQKIHFTPKMLECILQVGNFYRNACAHEDRLYNYKVKKMPSVTQISTALDVPQCDINSGNIYTIFSCLKLVISKEDYDQLSKQINWIFDNYQPLFTSIPFTDITTIMGFVK